MGHLCTWTQKTSKKNKQKLLNMLECFMIGIFATEKTVYTWKSTITLSVWDRQRQLLTRHSLYFAPWINGGKRESSKVDVFLLVRSLYNKQNNTCLQYLEIWNFSSRVQLNACSDPCNCGLADPALLACSDKTVDALRCHVQSRSICWLNCFVFYFNKSVCSNYAWSSF